MVCLYVCMHKIYIYTHIYVFSKEMYFGKDFLNKILAIGHEGSLLFLEMCRQGKVTCFHDWLILNKYVKNTI